MCRLQQSRSTDVLDGIRMPLRDTEPSCVSRVTSSPRRWPGDGHRKCREAAGPGTGLTLTAECAIAMHVHGGALCVG
jgi:hypothetical protein